MNINLNVKVRGGPRTPVRVDVFSTSVNEKTLTFKNGMTVTQDQIATWIKTELTRVLKVRQDTNVRAAAEMIFGLIDK